MSYVHKILRHYADADKWITVHPNGSDKTGSPVLIGEHGEVKAGMGGGFNGQILSDPHAESQALASGNEQREKILPRAFYPKAKRLIEHAPSHAFALWDKYGARIRCGNAHRKGEKSTFSYERMEFYFDAELDAVGDETKAPFQSFFHEAGHNLDWLAGREKYPGRKSFSTEYDGGAFYGCIKGEGTALVSRRRSQLRDEFYLKGAPAFLGAHPGVFRAVIDWRHGRTIYPGEWNEKWAGFILASEIRKHPWRESGALSDIIGGATDMAVNCGLGHSLRYWEEDTGRLGRETFATLYCAMVSNKKEYNLFREYLPRTVSLFETMLQEMVK